MPDFEVVLKKVGPQRVLSVRKVLKAYSSFGELFGILMPFLFQSGAQMIGPPIGIFHDKEYKDSDVDIELALPVATPVPASGEFKCYDLPGFDIVASLVFKGPWEKVAVAYEFLTKWIVTHGYLPAGPNREIYLTDPNSGVPPSEYVTEIQFPVTK